MSNENSNHKKETKQASTIIAVGSIIGLVICFAYAINQKTTVPLFLYAIFGGGILGTDNVVKVIKSIFRIGHD